VIAALFAASAAASHSTAFNKVEDVRVQPDNFPTQRLWAKERVVIELMSQGVGQGRDRKRKAGGRKPAPQLERLSTVPDANIIQDEMSAF
jgi:hypothetical protein